MSDQVVTREEVEEIVSQKIRPLHAGLSDLWEAMIRIEILSRRELGSLTEIHEIARRAMRAATESLNG